MPDIRIRKAVLTDCQELARLREALWPESSAEAHALELKAILDGTAGLVVPMDIFVAEGESGALVGFLEVGLRSCADGCDPSRAVGYVEGWYVAASYRKQGIGGKLLAAAEDWARQHGCGEMASDAQIENELSQRVHEAAGYTVVDRCVHYRKAL
jgi:aminoglycoside 6'-N-acetyltransferase I